MNNLYLPHQLLSVLLLTVSSALAQTNEEEAIKRVVQQELESIYGNYDQWANTWVHEPYILWVYNQPDGGFYKINGWEQLNKMIKTSIANLPLSVSKAVIEPTSYRVKQNGSIAFVTFIRVHTNANANVFQSLETRVLEKKVNGWKFIYASGFFPYNESRVGTTTPANQAFEKGKYSWTVNGFKWTQTFTDDGKFTTLRNNELVVEGTYKVTGDSIEITDTAGPRSCQGFTGRYKWRQDGKVLSFVKVEDWCIGRINAHTRQTWMRE